jgi:hypothetical protein
MHFDNGEVAANAPEVARNTAHCNKCCGERNHDVVAQYVEKFSEEGISGGSDYAVLRCRGCDEVSFQKSSWFSEDWDIDENGQQYNPIRIKSWPPPQKRSRPDWIDGWFPTLPRELWELISEVYTARDHNLRVLATIGVRTVFDRSSQLLGVESTLRFADKLEKLVDLELISKNDKRSLELLVQAGNAAAHRGWQPASADLDALINILEAFVQRAFVDPQIQTHLRGVIPAKPPKP